MFVIFSAIPLGIIVVRGDCDLETCRMYIDRLQEVRLLSIQVSLANLFYASFSSESRGQIIATTMYQEYCNLPTIETKILELRCDKKSTEKYPLNRKLKIILIPFK